LASENLLYMFKKIITGLLLIFCVTISISAQNISDTTLTTNNNSILDQENVIPEIIKADSFQVYSFSLQNDWLHSINKELSDTTLNVFHYTNPLYKKNNIYTSLGNTGLAAYNMFFSPNNAIGLDYGIHCFDTYLLNQSSLKFYDTKKPYSIIYYVMAPDKEQILNFHLNEKVYKSLTLGTDIKIINSVGPYYRQKARDARVAFKAHYVSDNKRYKAIAYYAHNKMDWMENGGIKYDSIFENNLETDRLVYPIKLKEANNLIIDTEVFLRHSFELSANKTKADSISSIKKHPFNLGKIQHEIKYHRQRLRYTETVDDSTYYQHYYNDFDDRFNTFDSTTFQTISNVISWKNSDLYRTKKSLGFDFGLTHKYIKIQEREGNNNLNQIILHARISKSIINKFIIGGEAEYIQGDYNNNDFKLSGVLTNSFGNNDNKRITLRLDQISRQPSWFYSTYSSNNFKWDNNLDKENIIKLSGNYSSDKISLGVNYFLLTNYTYINSDTMPNQAAKSFSVFQAYFSNNINLGHFNISDIIYLQKASTNKYLRLPEISGKIALSYRNSFFDNALYTQFGIDAQYKSSYFADAYMPALRSFYLQNDKKIGNFVYADIYASINIKRTNITIKYRHANQLISPYDYYDSPYYPMKDSGIVMAVSWRFHN